MPKKRKIFLKWLFGFIISIITSIIGSIIYAKIQDVKIIDTIIFLYQGIYNFLLNILQYKISIWFFMCFYLLYKIILKIKSNIDKPQILLPRWIDYKQDQFKVWLWKWDWKRDSNGNYKISNLTPYCASCNCRLTNISSILYPGFKCPKCETIYGGRYSLNRLENPQDTENLILHKIEENE